MSAFLTPGLIFCPQDRKSRNSDPEFTTKTRCKNWITNSISFFKHREDCGNSLYRNFGFCYSCFCDGIYCWVIQFHEYLYKSNFIILTFCYVFVLVVLGKPNLCLKKESKRFLSSLKVSLPIGKLIKGGLIKIYF